MEDNGIVFNCPRVKQSARTHKTSFVCSRIMKKQEQPRTACCAGLLSSGRESNAAIPRDFLQPAKDRNSAARKTKIQITRAPPLFRRIQVRVNDDFFRIIASHDSVVFVNEPDSGRQHDSTDKQDGNQNRAFNEFCLPYFLWISSSSSEESDSFAKSAGFPKCSIISCSVASGKR